MYAGLQQYIARCSISSGSHSAGPAWSSEFCRMQLGCCCCLHSIMVLKTMCRPCAMATNVESMMHRNQSSCISCTYH
jgi:hypothetical protein